MRTRKLLPILFLALVATAFGWSWATGGIASQLFGGELDAADRVEKLQQYFEDLGRWAPLFYFLFVVVEVVVAPIPGLMLYAPGGIIFGLLLGGSLSLAGNIAGAGLACWLTRTLGNTWLNRFFDDDKIDRAQAQFEARGTLLIFLLRLNPLTSSDIVSYAAGFTRIPIWKVMLATGLGMAPICYAQAWLAEGLIVAFPGLIYPLMIACVAYFVAVIFIVRRVITAPQSDSA